MTEAAAASARIRDLWAQPSFRFVALLLVYLVGLGVLFNELLLGAFPRALPWFVGLTAQLDYHVLSLFTSKVALNDRLLSYDGFTVRIVAECAGALEMLIFAACVLAYPTGWRQRAIGLALGVPAIYLFNVARIFCLLLVGRYYPASFDFFHLYFWQATLIVMITTLWLAWLYGVVRR